MVLHVFDGRKRFISFCQIFVKLTHGMFFVPKGKKLIFVENYFKNETEQSLFYQWKILLKEKWPPSV